MTEEQKNTQIQQECFCKKRFKDVIVVAIGTFVGVYCALSLFSAIHKPKFQPAPYFMPYGMHQQMGHFKRPPFNKGLLNGKFRGDFEKFDNGVNEGDFKPEKK